MRAIKFDWIKPSLVADEDDLDAYTIFLERQNDQWREASHPYLLGERGALYFGYTSVRQKGQ